MSVFTDEILADYIKEAIGKKDFTNHTFEQFCNELGLDPDKEFMD